jgi:hypothetical protein
MTENDDLFEPEEGAGSVVLGEEKAPPVPLSAREKEHDLADKNEYLARPSKKNVNTPDKKRAYEGF